MWHGLNDFRVKFKLDDETAEMFKGVNNKPEIIAEALKWYYSYGRELMNRLERIETMLASGVPAVKEPEAIKVKRVCTWEISIYSRGGHWPAPAILNLTQLYCVR